jgi:hypothetical protein
VRSLENLQREQSVMVMNAGRCNAHKEGSCEYYLFDEKSWVGTARNVAGMYVYGDTNCVQGNWLCALLIRF